MVTHRLHGRATSHARCALLQGPHADETFAFPPTLLTEGVPPLGGLADPCADSLTGVGDFACIDEGRVEGQERGDGYDPQGGERPQGEERRQATRELS